MTPPPQKKNLIQLFPWKGGKSPSPLGMRGYKTAQEGGGDIIPCPRIEISPETEKQRRSLLYRSEPVRRDPDPGVHLKFNIEREKLVFTMVFILDGCSFHVAHV